MVKFGEYENFSLPDSRGIISLKINDVRDNKRNDLADFFKQFCLEHNKNPKKTYELRLS